MYHSMGNLVVFPLGQFSNSLECCLWSDGHMHGLGVSSGVFKQCCWILSASLPPTPSTACFALSPCYYLVPWLSSFLVFLPESWGFSCPLCHTLTTSMLLSRAKQQKYWQRGKKKKAGIFTLAFWDHSFKCKRSFPPSVLGAFHPTVSTACHHSHSGLPGAGVWANRKEKKRK